MLPYSEKGNRIHDYPAHYSEINPWVKYYFKTFNDYFSKLGALFSESQKNPRVAVLQPIRSAYFDYDHKLMENGFGTDELDEKYNELLLKLESSGVEYHLLDETLLAKYGSIEENSIVCGKCKYDIWVLPYCITMDANTEKLLNTYLKNGGKVFLPYGKPQYIEWREFDYEYLNSNITWQDILSTRKYAFDYIGGRLCMSSFEKDGTEFLFVMNHSLNEVCKVDFHKSENYASFKAISLIDESEKILPLNFTLEPGESLLLIPFEEYVSSIKEAQIIIPESKYKVLDFEENYISIDSFRMSRNGTDYSDKKGIPMAFIELLKEHYDGPLYLKYEFEVEKIPETVVYELNVDRIKSVQINGVKFEGKEISNMLKCGMNFIEIEIDYFQNQNVYDVFFGENVTESMKNCLVYDTELTPLVLKGKFGVFEKKGFEKKDGAFWGKDFYISEVPEYIHSFVECGFPFFAGKISLSRNFESKGKDAVIKLNGRWHAAEISVNDNFIGNMLLTDRIDISSAVKESENSLRIDMTIGNRNLYGPHHYSAEAEPKMQGPEHFEFFDLVHPEETLEKYGELMSFIEPLNN